MPIIHIFMVERKIDAKKIATAVTDAVSKAVNIDREHVRVLVHEVPKDKWFVGGKPHK